jgi:hypothetical protein
MHSGASSLFRRRKVCGVAIEKSSDAVFTSALLWFWDCGGFAFCHRMRQMSLAHPKFRPPKCCQSR